MHEDVELPNPLTRNFQLSKVLEGIEKEKGKPPKQMEPITTEILYSMKSKLNFSDPKDISFWAACMVGFFGFLRKATLLPKTTSNPGSDSLLRKDLYWLAIDKFELRIRKTKTIQCGQRLLIIPYCASPCQSLCPVTAVLNLFKISSPSAEYPLFSYRKGEGYTTWNHDSFVNRFRELLKLLDLPPKKFSGHSFRRGGASLGYKLGLRMSQIKQRGDWRSAAVERYIVLNKDQEMQIAQSLSTGASRFLK